MDLAISAVTGDLASRFISFLMNKYTDHVCSEEKAERLQQLLLRVHTVVEEADGRCITNSCMLMQLKQLSSAMYQGYHVLDNVRYKQHKEASKDLVSDSSTSSDYIIPFKRARTAYSSTNKASNSGLQSALENLEGAVTDMVEFVVLLGGCERISRRPYDAYLQVDNFMFGRHVEKQKIINFLLQENIPGPPAVLPVVGGRGVGKKTLVAHVCRYDRVRSHFAVILHLNGDGLTRITYHEIPSGRTLVVVEFASDVDDDDWKIFYSSVTCMDRGNKVIILGRNESLKKLGTVQSISLNRLAFEEYRYLLKTLAFGSLKPGDHPWLATIVEEFAVVLEGSLVSANLLGYAVRNNLNAHFWLSTLNKIRITRKMIMSRFGCHPNGLFDQDRPVHFGSHHLLSPAARLIPSASCLDSSLPKVIFGDVLAEPGHIAPTKGDFRLISWESRLPPYTAFVHLSRFVPSCVDDKPEAPLSGRKRLGPSA
ncbi:putative disease resistance protein RGA3 [Triticum aestivum]|uniref:putative disease resistance protein RGA3 n=1 Tax=Triticum aestivum TaxID=4565 RepID=UPI0019492E40|nr:putative disease resistance protein RGA3 [Triticum aestivum]